MAKLKSIIKLKNAMNPNQNIGDIETYNFKLGFEVVVPIFDDDFEEYGFKKGVYLIDDSYKIFQIIDECLVYIEAFHPAEPDSQKFLMAAENENLVIGNSGVYRKLSHNEIIEMIDLEKEYPYVPSPALVINGKVHTSFKYGPLK